MDKINIKRQKPLHLVSLRLIISANTNPIKKQVMVANTAHVNVQASTGQNVADNFPPDANNAEKLSNPTQSNKFPGG